MAEVEIRQVSKRYEGGVRAVADVSLTIADREFLVLVGPSGCGKSTLLRMIAGLEEITEGEIAIGGRTVNDVQPKDRDVAMVFQNYALYPHMTVKQNMSFGLKLRRLKKDEIRQRVLQAARLLDIEELLDRKPGQLSGGQRQRVAVGRAIVRQPAVFLFDEPLSNLDARRRLEMRKELRELHQRLAATMIYVTHDQVEAMTLGNRIAVMRDGVIQQVGPPLELYDHPVNQFVAGFLGTPPMNFLSGTMSIDGDTALFRGEGFALELPAENTERANSSLDGQFQLGIRPEDLQFVEQTDSGAQIAATVLDIQPLGGESLIDLKVGEQAIVLRADAHQSITRGERRTVAFDPERAHLFDEEGSNLNVELGPLSAAQ